MMRKENSEEVEIHKLWMADGGKTQMNTVAQGTQARSQTCHKPTVVYTTYTRVQPGIKHIQI